MDMDTSLSSSSSLSPSSFFGSLALGADANPSFPCHPSSPGRRWRNSHRETRRFVVQSISGGGSDTHHFLDACFLCKKPISANEDIFMYRGNEPFCSNECRKKQMEMDEALENNRKKFSSSSSSINNSSSSASSMIKHEPSVIIHQNSRNVHALFASH